MKKVIATIIALIAIMSTASAEKYLRFGNIVDIEYDTDFVTVDDGMGNLWDFMSTPLAEYHFYGDLVVMIMDDNKTPDWIYDDMVTDAGFCDVEDANEIIRQYKENHSHIRF